MDIDADAPMEGDIGEADADGGGYYENVFGPPELNVRDHDGHVHEGPAEDLPHDLPPDAPRLARRRQHGYATVEVHENRARVIRWEYDDDVEAQPSPADILRQHEWFELGEWLAGLDVSDSERARYFEMKRVSIAV